MEILTRDFTYHLPEDRIALYPATSRDQSKLLVFKDNTISHHKFQSIANHLPAGSLLVFNNTKVIPARLKFVKPTGAEIEVFLLENTGLNTSNSAIWKCTIGNKKRWSLGQSLGVQQAGKQLSATLIDANENLVKLEWSAADSFESTLKYFGETPLPPYIHRQAEASDVERYQTVYSEVAGAVAAPTAGLHFTPQILEQLAAGGFDLEYFTLHVGAGTFKPITTEVATDHAMHAEKVSVSLHHLEQLIKHKGRAVAVGTTSARVLESLYWHAVKVLDNSTLDPSQWNIDQTTPYLFSRELPDALEAFNNLKSRMVNANRTTISGSTSIYIYPGYSFRTVKALVTNFHQPNSTLLLLIAALVGPQWKKIYAEALENKYRFLSYGDSSLLFPVNQIR